VTNRRGIQTALVFLVFCVAPPGLSVGQDSKNQQSNEILTESRPADFNREIYFKHKLEFSLDTGWLPNNIPFIFNPLMGEKWAQNPLDYKLVPLIFSLRWHWGDIAGASFIHGNTHLTFSGSYTVIPRGPEHLYAAFMFGVRRNFVQRNWRIVPYTEARGGVGYTDAKGPEGVLYARGQDLTFNFILGGGAVQRQSSIQHFNRYCLHACLQCLFIATESLRLWNKCLRPDSWHHRRVGQTSMTVSCPAGSGSCFIHEPAGMRSVVLCHHAKWYRPNTHDLPAAGLASVVIGPHHGVLRDFEGKAKGDGQVHRQLLPDPEAEELPTLTLH